MNQEEKRQFEQMKKDLESLSRTFYQNNFSAQIDENKFARFNTGLKIPHKDSLPASCELGELCEVGGKLYIASSANNWVLVGSQI